MSTQPDGGPAFGYNGLHAEKPYTGITVRDWFAAQALNSAIRRALDAMADQIKPNAFDFARVAQTAYRMADAMLAERGRAK